MIWLEFKKKIKQYQTNNSFFRILYSEEYDYLNIRYSKFFGLMIYSYNLIDNIRLEIESNTMYDYFDYDWWDDNIDNNLKEFSFGIKFNPSLDELIKFIDNHIDDNDIIIAIDVFGNMNDSNYSKILGISKNCHNEVYIASYDTLNERKIDSYFN